MAMTQFEQLVIRKLDEVQLAVGVISTRTAVHENRMEDLESQVAMNRSEIAEVKSDMQSVKTWRTSLAFVGAGMAGMLGIMGVDFIKYLVQYFTHRPDGK